MARGRPRKFDQAEAMERAMNLFWERGYESTGMAELVDKMGIGRQSIYNTFGDKKALFVKVLEHYQETHAQCMVDSLADSSSGMASLRGWIESWTGFSDAEQWRGCMLVNTLAEFGREDACVAEILRRTFERQEEAIFEVLERAKLEGELREGADSRSLAQGLLAMGQGVALMARIGVDEDRLKGIAKTALSALDNA